MSEITLNDIQEFVILVQVNGNCHQVLLTKEDKEMLKQFTFRIDGVRLSHAIEPVTFNPKK